MHSQTVRGDWRSQQAPLPSDIDQAIYGHRSRILPGPWTKLFGPLTPKHDTVDSLSAYLVVSPQTFFERGRNSLPPRRAPCNCPPGTPHLPRSAQCFSSHSEAPAQCRQTRCASEVRVPLEVRPADCSCSSPITGSGVRASTAFGKLTGYPAGYNPPRSRYMDC